MSARISLRRLLSVAAVSAFAVALMLGAASSAQASTTATCAFLGAAGPITPGPQGWIADASDLNITDTDSGTYSFATPANGTTCVGEVNGAPFAGNGIITSNGQYTNTFCGTGLVHSGPSTGNATTVVSAVKEGPVPDVSSASYDISFTAGQGPINVTSAALSNGDTVHSPTAGGNPVGFVSIAPTQPAPPGVPCATGPATAFDVSGFFTVTNRL